MTHSANVGPPHSLSDSFLAINPAALTLLRSISLEVSQAQDFDSALMRLLELVCASTDWFFGEIWLPSTAQTLRHSGIWYAARGGYQQFGEASRAWRFDSGDGLPGRVYSTGKSEWITDVSRTSPPTFQRRDIALQFGLGAAVGVPVKLDGAILMVLVFFMREAHVCDDYQVSLVEAIAAHLGAILRLKRTEAELFTHRQNLQRLLNTLPGIVFTAKGPPEWKMQSLSNGCTRLTGYGEAELTAADSQITYNDIIHADDLSRVLETIKSALAQGQIYEVEYRLVTRHGEEKWVWEKGQGLFDIAGQPIGLQGFITDITSLKRTEAALRKSETRYRMLADRSLDLVTQHDLNGNIRYVSSACSSLLGCDPAELIGQSPAWLFHPRDRRRVFRHYRRFLRRQVLGSLRFRMRHRSGHYRWFETISCMVAPHMAAGPPQLLAVTRDITETVEAEQMLIDREQFLKLILDNIPQHLFWKDRNGIYLGSNKAFAKGVGFDSSLEVMGKTDYEIPAYSQAEAQQFREQDRRIMAQDRPELDTLENDKNNPNYWTNVSKFPIHDAAQRVIGILGSIENVSDRIEFQKSLNRREQYLTALVEFQRQLLDFDGKWDSASFVTGLELLASVTGANRAYFYSVEPDNGDRLVMMVEWADTMTPSTLHEPAVQTFDREGVAADWIAELEAGNCINLVSDEFPPAMKELLDQPAINEKSVLLLPLSIHGQFSGVMGFSNCRQPRKWSQSEVSLLRIAVNAIAVATEHLQARASLRQAENKYRSIFENAVEGIFQTTTSGRYTTVNPMLAKIYGYGSPQELMETLTDIERQLYVDLDRRKTFVDKMMQDGSVLGFESAIYKKDGSIIWISESARAVFDSQGQIIGFEGTVEDITARKAAELELRRRDRLLKGVAEASQQLLTTLEIDSSIPKILKTLGMAAAADRVYLYENHPHPVTGKPALSMRYEWTQAGISPSIHQSHWQNQAYSEYGLMRWYRAFQAGHSVGGRVRSFPKSEQALLARDHIESILMVPVFIDRDFWGFIGFDACNPQRDWSRSEESILVTIAASIGGAIKRKETEAQMRYQAFHDPLTGLPNRTAFNRELPKMLAAARQAGRLVAILFLDLDRFKNINDTLGHAIGDQLLVEATRRLSEGLRRGDVLARWGGDEFTLILGQIFSIEEAARVAERLADNLRPPFLIDHHELYVTGSIGIALYPNDGDSVTALLQNADAAMYAAKASGRNSYCFYTSTLSSGATQQLMLEKHLHQAFKREEFSLCFQPQIDMASGRIQRIEALVRWHSAELGEVAPNDFIPVAEEIGLIVSLGDWVIKQACSQLKAWHQQGFESLEVAVNLSARQLHHATLVQDIQQVLSAFNLSPKFLELEITETVALSNLEISVSTLNQLRRLGNRIVMDDFGTGYSSLNYLKRLPFTGLKIDRSFVQDIPQDEQDIAMLRAVIALGQALNLSLVAEGVETVEQMHCLSQLGCHQMQGFLFSQPLSSQAMTEFLYRHWPVYDIHAGID
ncbi:MAG: EAL domain-containing protein [Leptolyngbyaceae cyanobacterium]